VAPLGRKLQNLLASLWGEGFSTLLFAARLRFGDAFPLALEHPFAFKLSDRAQLRPHELAGGYEVSRPRLRIRTTTRLRSSA